MKKVIASAGLLACAVGLPNARADFWSGPDKPWTISGTLRGFYDDNYNTQPNGPNRVGSWGLEFRPSLSYKYNNGPDTVSLSYVYDLNDYTQRPGDQIDQAHEFDLTANHNFSERYSGDIEESFVDSQEPAVLSGTGPAVTPLRANGDNYHNVVGINFHAMLTREITLVLGYNNNWFDFTGSQLPQSGQPSFGTLLNSFIHTWSVDARYQVDEKTTAILEYKFSWTDYLSQGSLAPAGSPYVAPNTRNNYQHFIDAGIEHNFLPDFGVNVHAGVQISDYFNSQNVPGGSDPSSVTPYVNLSANYTYADSGVLSLGFSHMKNQTDIGYDLQDHTLTQDEESSTLYLSVVQVMKFLTPDLTGSLTFQYQDSTLNGGGYDGAVEDFYQVGVDLTYKLTQNFSAEAGYNYYLLDSGVPVLGAGRGYDRNRVYLGLTATY